MNRFLIWLSCTFLCLAIVSCSDDDSFSASPANHLTFSTDTVKLDTVFSKVPTATKTFWVYNRSGDGIRCSNIRLANGNQTGFRVNVDGSYLGATSGYQINDLEIRKNDSIRVFVELTSPSNNQEVPTLLQDDLVFSLESGTQQKVNLRAWTWDVEMWTDPVIDSDTTIPASAPIIIYGGLTVNKGATLTIEPGATLFFHADAGMEVYGRLIVNGTPEKNVVLRGDRIDRMFDYLPYDRVSGQWNGVHFHESSTDNELVETVIKNAIEGVVMDKAELDENHDRLSMTHCVVHNSKGTGVRTVGSSIRLDHCQLTNAGGDCLAVIGGKAEISYCTIAQFYPFDASRGKALRMANETENPLKHFDCEGTIVTGYADDELEGEQISDEVDYHFKNCLLRTIVEEEARFEDIIWESPTDEIEGKKQFMKIDEENLDYDFHLNEESTAKGKGCY